MNRLFLWILKRKHNYRKRRGYTEFPDTVVRRFQELFIKTDVRDLIIRHEIRQVRSCFGAIIAFLVLFIIVFRSAAQNTYLMEDRFLVRPERDMEEYRLTVEGLPDKQEVIVEAEARRYRPEELPEIFLQTAEKMKEVALGSNPSWEQVSDPLNLAGAYLDSGIAVSWETESPELIDPAGEVAAWGLDEAGEMAGLRLILKYQEQEQFFRIPVRIVPPKLTEQELLKVELEMEIHRRMQENSNEGVVLLPEEIQGFPVTYQEPVSKDPYLVLVLGLLSVVLYGLSGSRKLKAKVQKRDRQMMLDYAGVVSKLTLFLDCGMTVRGAWERIVEDYEYKRNTFGQEWRYAYEEMKLAGHLMRNGTSEAKAYGIFSNRCRVYPYMRLGGLLEQQLKRGGHDLKHLLAEEVKAAYVQQMQEVRKLGEEAGIRLLVPMLIIFLLLLAIIFIPALLSFSGL